MSENMIFCYSGSGNCLDMAIKIARLLGDTDIVMMRRAPVVTDATAAKRVGFIFPCYGGGLPGGVEEYVRSIKINPASYVFAVEQYAAYKGCGLYVIDSIVNLDYWYGVSNHCSAIWLFPHYLTMPMTTLAEAQLRTDAAALTVARSVQRMEKSAKKPPKNEAFRLESNMFGNINQKVNAAMTVNDDCIACGLCERLCPRENIKTESGKAVIGTNCIGCMACVEYCPQEAINVGKITVKRARYHNANVSAGELCEKIIHVD